MINSGIQCWAGKDRSVTDLTKSGEKRHTWRAEHLKSNSSWIASEKRQNPGV